MKDLAQSSNKTIRINLALEQGCALPGVFFTADHGTTLGDGSVALRVPCRPEARRKFLKAWARKNSRRMAQGLGILALVLPFAGAANAQEGPVAAETISGVSDVALLEDGDALITLADGRQLRVSSENVSVGDDGTVFLSGPAAEAIMIAGADVVVPEGGMSIAAIGAGAGGLLLAAAGGGGGGGSDGPAPQPVELGYAIDGYLSGATVFADSNRDGLLTPGELQTTTAANGSFNTAIFEGVSGPLVTIGGTDISTGEPFTGSLRAPEGSTNITPLTTLVQNLVESSASGETPLTVEEATASVASSLGLEGDAAQLLTVDPVILAENGNTTQLQAAAKVAAVINLVTAAAPDNPDAVTAVLSELTTDLTDGDNSDPFTSSDAIATALTNAGDAIEVNVSDLATVIVDVTTAIDSVSGETALSDLEQIQTAVQGDLTTAVETSVGVDEATAPIATTNVTATVEATVGLRPVITSFTEVTGPIAEGSTITISGTGRIGSTISVELGEATRFVGVADGTWTVTFTGDEFLEAGTPEGTVTALVTATDAGVISSAAIAPPSYIIDNAPPAAPTIAAVSDDNIVGLADVSNDTYTITGTTEDGTTVDVTVDGVTSAAVVNGTTWTYTVAVPTGGTTGQNVITATATDAAGNTSPVSATLEVTVDTQAPPAPVISDATGAINAEDAASLVISGSAEGLSTVTLTSTLFAAPITVTTDGDGFWTTGPLDLSGAASGTYDISATSTDAAGNESPAGTSTREFDVGAPAAPFINTVSEDNFVGIADLTGGSYTISGTTESGTTVEVSVNGGTAEAATMNGTSWSYVVTPTAGTEFEANNISVVAQDGAGNTSPAAELQVNVDLTNPPAPSIDTIADPVTAAGIETVVISGTAEPNTIVTLTIPGLADPIVVSVGVGDGLADNAWATAPLNLDTLADGDYTISAISTDEAGNTSEVGTSLLVIDVQAPAAPIINTVSDDNVVGIADLTNGSYTISGTTEAGTTVEVSLNGVTGAATVDGTSWSYVVTPTAGTEFEANVISVVATDAGGNTSPAAEVQINVDLTNPPTPFINPIGDLTESTAATAIVISGTAEPNTTVTLTIPGLADPIVVSVGVGDGLADNAWVTGPLDLSGLADGLYNISVFSTDAAGNTSAVGTSEVIVDFVPDDAPVITVFDTADGQPFLAGELIVYDDIELFEIGEDGLNETLPGTITNVPVGTTVTLTIQDASGNDLRGPYTAQTIDAEGNFTLSVPDTDITSLDGMTSAATVTVSGGGASFVMKAIVNGNINGVGSTQVLVGDTVVDPTADISVFGTEGPNPITRTLLDGATFDTGGIAVAEIIDDNSTTAPQYTAVLYYDGVNTEPTRAFAFDGGAEGEIIPRTTKIDARSDGIVVTQLNVSIDGSGVPTIGDPVFNTYFIPADQVATAIPDAQSTATNLDLNVPGTQTFTITLADLGGAPLDGEFYDLHFLPDVPGNPVFVAVREPTDEGGTGATEAVIGVIDLATNEVITRSVSVDSVAPGGSYERDAVLQSIAIDQDGNYISITLPDSFQDGFERTQTLDFATEKFFGGTLGNNDTQDLMVASNFREIIDGGDVTLQDSNDNDTIVVGNQTDNSGVLQTSIAGGVATVSLDATAILNEPDLAGLDTISVTLNLFTAGGATLSADPATSGTYTTVTGQTGTSAYATDIGLTQVTFDIDLAALRIADPAPGMIDLAGIGITVPDAVTEPNVFYGFGASLSNTADVFFDGFNEVGGVEEGDRKIVILENSQGRGGADTISGFDVNTGDIDAQDLLLIEADSGNYRGETIEYVGAAQVTLGATTGIVIFEGITEDDDPAVIQRAIDANLGLQNDESVIVVTADADNTSLWSLTYFEANNTYELDSFGKLSGVTADDLRSFTDDGITNIALQLPPELPTV